MKNIVILKPLRNARKAAGGALGVLFTAVALLVGGPLALGTLVESMNSSVLAADVGEDETLSQPPERLYGTWTAKDKVELRK